jgi:hypothetical protein
MPRVGLVVGLLLFTVATFFISSGTPSLSPIGLSAFGSVSLHLLAVISVLMHHVVMRCVCVEMRSHSLAC